MCIELKYEFSQPKLNGSSFWGSYLKLLSIFSFVVQHSFASMYACECVLVHACPNISHFWCVVTHFILCSHVCIHGQSTCQFRIYWMHFIQSILRWISAFRIFIAFFFYSLFNGFSQLLNIFSNSFCLFFVFIVLMCTRKSDAQIVIDILRITIELTTLKKTRGTNKQALAFISGQNVLFSLIVSFVYITICAFADVLSMRQKEFT